MATAKSIKGITIEIAGDTKKLGAALKGVNDQSQDLSASLKYVDQLLKFDPGNTELLAEKQKILADSVDNTSDKLETLKSLQAQIKQQYASGEIGQRAYLDFQAELGRTERKLEDLRQESDKVADTLNRTGDEAEESALQFNRFGDFVDDASDELSGLKNALMPFGGKLTGAVAGGLAAVGAAALSVVDSTQEYREEMAKLDISYQSANLNAEAAETAYRKLYRVLGETDQSVEAAQQIALLSDSTEAVARWSAQASGLVARFGDALQPETFYESANETLKLNAATGAFVQLLEGTGIISVEEFDKELQALNTDAEKQAYMLEVTESLLGDAAAAYEQRNEDVLAARDADARWNEAMGEISETISPLATSVKNFGADIVEQFVPKIQNGVDLLGDLGTAFSDVGKQLKEDWPEIVSWWNEQWTGFTDYLKGMSQGTRDFLSETADVSSYVNGTVSQNLENINRMTMTAEERMRSGAETFYDPWIGAGASFNETCAGIMDSYNDMVTEISNTPLRIPHPKVPKFAISGKFSLESGSVPKINVLWNATGGILTGPTIFGSLGGQLLGGGEAGQEAVLPLSSFYANLERILSRQGAAKSQTLVNIERFEHHTDDDLDALVDKIVDRVDARQTRQYLRKAGGMY